MEETIRTLVAGPAWARNPVQFLVVDLSLVAGVDMSSAEAFMRVQRLLAGKRIVLVFCGLVAGSGVYKALESIGLFGMEGVELFVAPNDAMECASLALFPPRVVMLAADGGRFRD